MLNEPLGLYCTQLEFNSAGSESPYCFYPVQSGDTTRCLPSSQWTQFIKACFRKHTEGGKAPPPKLLRASFISWLRDSSDAPTVLASAAKCMRHQTATQESDHYDKGHHDRKQDPQKILLTHDTHMWLTLSFPYRIDGRGGAVQ